MADGLVGGKLHHRIAGYRTALFRPIRKSGGKINGGFSAWKFNLSDNTGSNL